MRSLLPQSALLITMALLVTACQGEPEEPAEDPAPSPVPAAEMEPAELPDDPADLADLVNERMTEALSVEVAMEVAPEEEEEGEASIEDVSMQLLLDDPPSAKMTVVDNSEDRPSTAHVIVADKTVYMMLEEEPLLEDKDWLRLTRSEIDEAEEEIGPFAEIFRVMLTETTTSVEEAAGKSSMDAVRFGELDGDPETTDSEENGTVTVYSGTTATSALADRDHKSFKDAADAGLEEVSWDLAVTDRGLPESFAIEMATPDGETARSTVRYTDWGSDFDISAPADDNVGTIQESMDAA
ncbi:hypothetical protein [Nocardiopsis coralliicola]